MLSPLMPMIRSDLSLSYTEVGFVASAFGIASGISQLPAGYLVDRIGTRIMVLLGVSGVATAGLLIGLSQSYIFLVVCLILAALMGGGYHPASGTAISTIIQPQQRGRALGLHTIGGSSSFWIVPLLATPIAVAWGWHGAFLTLSIPAIILGIVLFILIGKQKTKQVARSQTTIIATEIPSKIIWRKLVPFLLLTVTTATMLQSANAYLSLYAVDILGVSKPTAALLMTVMPLGGLLAAPLGGYLSDRFGGVPVLIIVSCLAIPLIYLLGVISSVPLFIVIMAGMGLVNFIRMPTSESYIINNIPEQRRGTFLGIYFFAGAEVSGLLIPVMGNLIDHKGFQSSFMIAAGIAGVIIIACSIFLWFNRRTASTQG